MQGYRLVGGRYVRLELLDDRLHSEQLGLDLVQSGETLRLFDPQRGEFLLMVQEQAERANAEARRADAEARRAAQASNRAETAEAEVARLRAELDALKDREL